MSDQPPTRQDAHSGDLSYWFSLADGPQLVYSDGRSCVRLDRGIPSGLDRRTIALITALLEVADEHIVAAKSWTNEASGVSQ
jgi:hypothetical protein